MLLTEIFGELLAVEGVEVLAGIGQLLRTGEDEREVGTADDTFQAGHGLGIDGTSHIVACKEEFGIRVVHDVVNLFGHELVQDGHGNGSVGQGSDEGHGPLAGVASAECYLVSFLYA